MLENQSSDVMTANGRRFARWRRSPGVIAHTAAAAAMKKRDKGFESLNVVATAGNGESNIRLRFGPWNCIGLVELESQINFCSNSNPS